MKFLIYARVSPKGSSWAASETSIPTQLDLCRQYVRGHGGEVVDVVTDEMESGRNTQRPGLQRILRELDGSQSPEWDALIFYKLDRLSRSLRDVIEIADSLRRHGRGFVSLSEQLDFATPTGRAMLYIFSVFAQWEREMTGQRTKDRMVQIARGGGWPSGKCPTGYRRGSAHDNRLYVDERAAEVVRDLYRSAADGVRLADIYARHQQLHPNTILGILRRRVYLGVIEYDGQEYPGLHDAIIDRSTWDRVQAMHGRRDGPRPAAQTYVYLLAGLLYCRCGRAMTPCSAHGRTRRYHYYRCTDRVGCRGPTVPAHRVERDVLDAMGSVRIDEQDIADAVAVLAARREREAGADARRELSEVDAALKQARASIDHLLGAFAHGLVTPGNAAAINARITTTQAEVDRLQARREELSAVSDIDPYAVAQASIRRIRSLADVDRPDGDPYALRAWIQAHVERIDQEEGDMWRITPTWGLSLDGASKPPRWLPIVSLNAPHRRRGKPGPAKMPRVVVCQASASSSSSSSSSPS